MENHRRDAKREHLIEAAGQVFAAKGYEGATVREICEQAGLNIAAIGYYFRGKERLYEASIAHAAACLREELPQRSLETTPVERFRAIVHAVVNAASGRQNPSWRLQVILRESLYPKDDACTALAREALRPLLESLMEVLTKLLPPGTPKTTVALIALSALCQCLACRLAEIVLSPEARKQDARLSDPSPLSERIVEFTLSGLVRWERDSFPLSGES